MKVELDELTERFTYHSPKGDQTERYSKIRSMGKDLAQTVVDLCPDSRELSLSLAKIEEAVMWANAAIARRG